MASVHLSLPVHGISALVIASTRHLSLPVHGISTRVIAGESYYT